MLRAAGKQQMPGVGRTGVQAGKQDHCQKALHAKARQQRHHPANAQDGIPHAVAEGRLLLPYPFHGTVHHAFQIHQRHGRSQRFQIKPGIRTLVQKLCQRPSPHPEQHPCQRGKIAGEPQHPVQKCFEPFGLAQNMGLRDLRHQQHRKTAQQAKWERKQRQSHAFQFSVLLQRDGAPARVDQIDRKAGGHQHILRRVQGACQHPPALHRPQDLPQTAGRVCRADGFLPRKGTAGIPPVKGQHAQRRHRFADGGSSQHQHTAHAHRKALGTSKRQCHQRDAHRLLRKLAEHIGSYIPSGDEKTAQHRRHCHPWHSQR